MTAGTGVRHWIVWPDSGHRVTRHDSGHWVIRQLDRLARQQASGHQA
ncbi:unnamed protein product [Staurois parvus]|uniref:Uncharacterized protein n=1 Tax=Staurois parvus TaxID=386267 RepID=A0ABN9HU46_9NEOB|nr:unnamed protein product [Staurois parvus]